MTSYQFFMVKNFPTFTRARTEISNQVQTSLLGGTDKIHTKITPAPNTKKAGYELLRVETGIKYEVHGYTYIYRDGKREKTDISDYIKLINFDAYLIRDENALILKASEKVARGFLNNIKSDTGISLASAEIDFDKVHKEYPNYIAAWFKEISPSVRSLGMSGINIEDSVQFKQCLALGVISALAMKHPLEGLDHPFVITKRASISLYKNYTKSHVQESKVVLDIFKSVILKTWTERKKGKKDLDLPTVVDPEFHDFDTESPDHKADEDNK